MLAVNQVMNEIVEPLTYICNISFQSGIFPKGMKNAKVVSIFKDGDKHHYTNNRPICILSQFSKIIEIIFDKRLSKFVDKYHLLDENQCGFMKGRSTPCL